MMPLICQHFFFITTLKPFLWVLKCSTDAGINNSLHLLLLKSRFHWDHFFKVSVGDWFGRRKGTEHHWEPRFYSVFEGPQSHRKACLIQHWAQPFTLKAAETEQGSMNRSQLPFHFYFPQLLPVGFRGEVNPHSQLREEDWIRRREAELVSPWVSDPFCWVSTTRSHQQDGWATHRGTSW